MWFKIGYRLFSKACAILLAFKLNDYNHKT